jgi:glyoxylase-like metal-dependent hydrolase (beta-lactamase superfamily II)
MVIWALADAAGRFSFAVLKDLAPEEIVALTGSLANAEDQTLARSLNAFVVKRPNVLIVVDTGLGEGRVLADGLELAGLKPEEVTDVLLTHLHRDHVNGLLAGQEILFPGATVWVEAQELAYWRQKAEETSDERARTVMAKLNPYLQKGSARTFGAGQTLKPGLETIELYGHTPGHVGFLLGEGERRVLFFGDVAHVAAIQFSRPEVTVTFDVDPAQAAQTRAQIYQLAARANYLVAGAHAPFPGLGRIKALSPKPRPTYAWLGLTV